MGRTSTAKIQLIEGAIELIHQRSYTGVGVQELCDFAHVKKGSFYHFFGSKQELMLAALDHQWEWNRQQYWNLTLGAAGPPLARIQRFFDQGYTHHRDDFAADGKMKGCPFGSLAAELSTQDNAIRLKLADIFAEVQHLIEQTLAEAVRLKALAPIDVQASAKALVTYWQGVLLMAKTQQDPELIREMTDGIWRALLIGEKIID